MKNQENLQKELKSLHYEIAGLRSELGRLVEMVGKQNTLNVSPAAESEVEKETVDNRIFNLLLTYKVPAHLKGFKYLKEAIKIYVNGQASLPITKVLYPTIAKKFDDTPSRVERAIRHAIERSYEKSHASNSSYFRGYTETKPTNSEFIALASGVLLMGKEEIA